VIEAPAPPAPLAPFVEWEHRAVELDFEVMTALSRVRGDAISVGLTGTPGTYDVSTAQYVGTIVLPEVSVLIRPKVGLANLLYLLEPDGQAIDLQPETFRFKATPEVVPAFATLVAATIERAIGRGLLRSYRTESESLMVLRGQIDFPNRARRAWSEVPVPCVFDEFTADNLENRFVLAAVRRLLRTPSVASTTRQRLAQQQLRLEEVSMVHVEPDVVDRVVYTRLNRHYRPALSLCRHVIDATSIVDETGKAGASSFLLNMNKVFERFLEVRLRQALLGRLEVVGQDQSRLDEGGSVGVQPDLLFLRDGRAVFVGDAKYKLTKTGLGPESDVHQLLAYATAYGLAEGVLVYVKDGAAQPRELRVRNSNKVLWTWPIDLTGDRTAIDREIHRLADWIAASTTDPSSTSNGDSRIGYLGPPRQVERRPRSSLGD
jgi:5-methylcytosine-specific restriction enzyme subunit McrC